MATFTFCKDHPDDPRIIQFEIEHATAALALAYSCSADVIAWSAEDEPVSSVRIELHDGEDLDAAATWFADELSKRGIVAVRDAMDKPQERCDDRITPPFAASR